MKSAFYAERAKGNVGLIVTGGISPNDVGLVATGSAKMSTKHEVELHRVVTNAVHEHGGRIAMQILHAGAYHFDCCIETTFTHFFVTMTCLQIRSIRQYSVSCGRFNPQVAHHCPCAHCSH